MKLHELKPNVKKVARKRKGQGNGSGQGTFGGRGLNGQNSRAGGGVRPGFEGGQTPLIKRMPKLRGFRSPFKVINTPVSLGELEASFDSGETVNLETLVQKKLINKSDAAVKILAKGELKKELTIESPIKVSATAKAQIEKAGGKVTE